MSGIERLEKSIAFTDDVTANIIEGKLKKLRSKAATAAEVVDEEAVVQEVRQSQADKVGCFV